MLFFLCEWRIAVNWVKVDWGEFFSLQGQRRSLNNDDSFFLSRTGGSSSTFGKAFQSHRSVLGMQSGLPAWSICVYSVHVFHLQGFLLELFPVNSFEPYNHYSSQASIKTTSPLWPLSADPQKRPIQSPAWQWLLKHYPKKSKWLLGLDKLISDYQRSSKKRKNHLKTPKRISYQVYFVKEEIRCLQCLKQTFYSLPFLLIIGHQFLVSLYFCYIKLYLGFCFLFVLYLNQKYFCKENFCTLWKFWYQIASNNTLPSSLPPLTSNSQPSTCTWAIPLYL